MNVIIIIKAYFISTKIESHTSSLWAWQMSRTRTRDEVLSRFEKYPSWGEKKFFAILVGIFFIRS